MLRSRPGFSRYGGWPVTAGVAGRMIGFARQPNTNVTVCPKARTCMRDLNQNVAFRGGLCTLESTRDRATELNRTALKAPKRCLSECIYTDSFRCSVTCGHLTSLFTLSTKFSRKHIVSTILWLFQNIIPSLSEIGSTCITVLTIFLYGSHVMLC